MATTAEYGDEFYDALREDWPHQQRCILGTVALHGVPDGYIDVGCGSGATVDALARLLGDDRAVGYEQAQMLDWAARSPHGQPRGTFIGIDLAKHGFRPGPGVERAELVTSWEVAEHLPEKRADPFVESVASVVAPGGRLVFTAATPGQPGHGHVNCQPKDYWIAKFSAAGLELERQWTAWQEVIFDHVANPLLWLRDNVIVFSKPGGD
jgi:cyclopropane fatty-acyl-phospholipid synthase-like methyltransferase